MGCMSIETSLAAASLIGIVAGITGTVRGGGWRWRTLLVVCSLTWPFPRHPFEGPVLVTLVQEHGLHAADLVSLLGLTVALAWPRSGRAEIRDPSITPDA